MARTVSFRFEGTENPDVEDPSTAVLLNGVEVANIQHAMIGGGYFVGWWVDSKHSAWLDGPEFRRLAAAKAWCKRVFESEPELPGASAEMAQTLHHAWAEKICHDERRF